MPIISDIPFWPNICQLLTRGDSILGRTRFHIWKQSDTDSQFSYVKLSFFGSQIEALLSIGKGLRSPSKTNFNITATAGLGQVTDPDLRSSQAEQASQLLLENYVATRHGPLYGEFWGPKTLHSIIDGIL